MIFLHEITHYYFIILVVTVTRPSSPLFLDFTATFLWCSLPNCVRAAAKLTARCLGSPYNQRFTGVSYHLVQTTVVKTSSVE